MKLEKYHLRIFLESTCNFRCVYCNPDADRQEGKIINDLEVRNILKAAFENGISRVHYSGGEPTLRKGLPNLIAYAKELGYVDQVITTNGVLLDRYFDEYISAGLSRSNISIDSLNRNAFKDFTERDELESVLRAINKSVEKFGEVKINIVVMKRNLHEILDFIRFSEAYGGKIICRFIELQSNQPVFYDNKEKISDQHITLEDIQLEISKHGNFQVDLSVTGENPNCTYYKFKNSSLRFGIIANHSRGYPCGDCHKVRISPYGDMGVCINAEGINIKNTDYNAINDALKLSIERREILDEVYPDRHHHSNVYGFWRWGDVSLKKTGKQEEIKVKNRDI